MTTSPNRPSLQLFNQLFDVQRSKEYSALKEYLDDGGAFFSLVEKGARGLERDFNVSAQDAQRFIRAANALAIVVRRQFIERTSCLDEATPYQPSSGLLSIVAGPSYEELFRPNFDLMCPPNALESWTSPAAYLIDLLRWIRDRIETEADGNEIPLHERRHDLKSLMVDANAVYQPASAVDIIVSVLEAFIKEHKPSVADVDEAMSTAHYPNTLPYYRDWTTINHVARLHGMSVGNMARTVDLSFPYFLQHNAKSEESGRALLHGSRLGPYQREMLTEPLLDSLDTEELAPFYRLNFGSHGFDHWQNLNQVKYFCERTNRLALDIEQLLSIRSFVPLRSPNAPDVPLAAEAYQSGSVYINGGLPPSLGIDFRGSISLHRFTQDPHTSSARYDRMNRKIRLDQWLNLPTEHVDALLVAAIKAEDPGAPYLITDKTLQALGLFQDLRERYGCLAEDFAVFIGELSVYGRGETLSSFDRAFNAQALFSTPLQLDGGEFPVFPEPGVETLTVKQICSGLGIDLYTYRHLAQAIARAHTLGTLVRTAPVLSSFYRLVKIARLLGITPVEGLLMLATLGGVSWVNALAGVPRLYVDPEGVLPDTLNVIHALESCVGWCRERELPVLWMLQQVTPVVAPVASANELRLFAQVRSLYPSALLSNAALLMAGVPPLTGGADWLDLLTSLVSRSGLVLAQSPAIELDYPAFARAELDLAVRDGLGEMEPSVRLAIVDTMLAVLLQARAGQVSVVKECVAVYAGLNSELVPAVLDWADMTVYQLLFYVQELADVEEAGADVSWRLEPVIDPFLGRLAEVRRRSAVVVRLELSVELLEDYLSYGYDAWLGSSDKHELTVRTLYYLTVLVRAFGLSQQPPGRLLEYLRAVDALPDPLTGDALSLAREAAAIRLAAFFGWSVQDVRECASQVGNSIGVIRTLTELDLLIRVRVLASANNMDAETIFLMGLLPQALGREAYATAAEHALQSLNETPEELIPDLEEALGQVARMTWIVDKTTLIANKPGEKAVFTVTVTDANLSPLSGVTVYWQSSLGVISKSDTDPSGVATAEFVPGNIMGTATLYCWLDLLEKLQAATLIIGPDPATLEFPSMLMSEVPDREVPFGQSIELFAVMKDRFTNLGIGIPVRWGWEAIPDESGIARDNPQLTIRPDDALTNDKGLTQVDVSSATGGTFEVKIDIELPGNNTVALFEYITFAGPPLLR
ncbi:virulence plasmid 28 protein [Pseudomonas sp. GM79]|uniref:Tc toxin subunit A n=1 Tax=Pseudomonas sp. GM79 TaxID=1144338 RepID=UPI00026F8D6D|nr:Tc toxin subunit A [Pseudomonas sp. GM79]EJN25745.1 virulence plasmid 28 protein [Pseudomonas sp. GM79]